MKTILSLFCIGLSVFVTAQDLTLEILDPHQDAVTSLIISDQYGLLYSGAKDGMIHAWDLAEGEKQFTLNNLENGVEDMVLQADILIGSGREDDIFVWDAKSGKQQSIMQGHTYYVETLDMCDKTLLLASGSRDNSIKLWAPHKGKKVSYLNGHEDDIQSVAFSPDGNYLASSSDDNSLRVWYVPNRKLVNELNGSQLVQQLIYSADGQYLIGAMGKTMIVWDTETWEIAYRLRGHTKDIRTIALRPQSNILASAGDDHKVIFWNLNTGKLIRSFVPHESPVTAIGFNENGNKLATGGRKKQIQLWDISVLDQ